MVEEALEVATDPDYRFDLAIQLGRLDIAKVNPHDFFSEDISYHGEFIYLFILLTSM